MCENKQNVSGKLWKLRDIAEGLNKKESDNNQDKIRITIPAIQRGKVWNAVRCEILWDSILRGIPIGAFSVSATSEREFLLLDGQQRANAISLGYQNNTEKSESILWLDLGTIAKKDIEQNDGSKKPSDRKYFFMVTTKSQPWGYNLSDNETSNKLLSASEKKYAIKMMNDINVTKWIRSEKHDRPSPYDLWPCKAKCPIPFSTVREYIETHVENASFNDFICHCQRCFKSKEPNWLKKLIKERDESNNTTTIWESVKKGITDHLKSAQVLVQVITSLSDYETSVFFRRMNKSGVVPNDEEIRYSMLKARIPKLKDLDSLAEKRMPPAVLADIAISSFFIRPLPDNPRQSWRSGVSYQMVNELLETNKEAFCEYVDSKRDDGLKESIEGLEDLLICNSNKFYLPKYVFSMLAKQNRDLYRLLIFVFQKWKKAIEGDKPWWNQKLIALVTLVCWFKNKDNMMSDGYSIYDECIKVTKEDWEQCTKRWLLTSIQQNKMTPPTPLSVYKEMNDNRDFVKILESPAYCDGINKIWSWRSELGRALLLFVFRNYLTEEFANYNPSDAAWSEENRPWDYDHIIPQSWLISGQGNKQGDYHYLVNKMLNSIGNIAPIPFDMNREKNDAPPGDYLNKKNEMVFVDSDTLARFKSPKEQGGYYIEEKEEDAMCFANIVTSRFCKIYQEWYEGLCVDCFFKFENNDREIDRRRFLFEQIKEKLETVYRIKSDIVFACADGRQYKCTCNADWARPWLSVIVSNTNNNVSPAVTANNSIIEFGLRRHPSQNSIDGQDKWWTKYEKMPYDTENSNPDFLANKILDMVRSSPENSN